MEAIIVDIDQQDLEEYESMKKELENVDDLQTECDIDEDIAEWNDVPVEGTEFETKICEEMIEYDEAKIEEVDKLRVANDKLRYRINILKAATEKELSLKETGETRTDDDNDITDDDASLETVKMTAADNHSDSRSDTVSDNVKTISDNIEVINETLEKCRINESAKEMPFKIQYKEGVGNYVVANRDIKPNEVRSLIQQIQYR